MAVVDIAIAAGTALGVGGGGVAAGLVGGAAIGAGAGALYSGVTGDGNILNSALTGAMIGGGVGGGGAALGLTGATGTSLGLAGTGALSGVGSALGLAGTASTPAMAAAALPGAAAAVPEALSGTAAFGGAGAASVPAAGYEAVAAPALASGAPAAVAPAVSEMAINPATGLSWEATGSGLTGNGATVTAKDLLAANSAGAGLTGKEMLGYGLAGTAALSLLGGMNQKKIPTQPIGQNPSMIRPYTYSSTQNQSAYPTGPQYGANGLPILPTSEQRYFNQSYTAGTPYKAADGGLMSVPTPGLMDGANRANVDFMGGDMYPTSQQHRSYYATPTQMPTSAQQVAASYEPRTNPLTGQMTANMAAGGQINLQGTFTNDDAGSRNNPFEQRQSLGGLYGGFGGFSPEARAFQEANQQGGPEAQQSALGALAASMRGFNSQDSQFTQGGSQAAQQSNWGGPSAQNSPSMPNGPDTTQFQMRGMRGIGFADGGYTYDATNQRYNKQLPPGVNTYESLAPMGFGLGASRFANFGEVDPLGGNPFGFGGGENLSFQPATKLDPQSLAAMTAQWQAQNPNKRTYDPATQRYGYATPDQGTLLAMKNAQDLAAYQAQQQPQQQSYDGGGAAAGGLMSGYAMGGQAYNLGGYSDGGRLLKGPGDGVSDDIPAVIGNKQPARLADGEFVIPARIVSELGNGSTDAGAKRLYAMMDRIQSGRKKTVGKDKVAVDTKAEKNLPA